MKNHAIKFGIIAGILPHLFCCVLPIVLGVIGMIAPDMISNHEIIPESAEIWVFVFSGLMLALSWIMHLGRRDCECDHCNSTRHHRRQRIILICITIVTIVGIVMHLVAHH